MYLEWCCHWFRAVSRFCWIAKVGLAESLEVWRTAAQLLIALGSDQQCVVC